MKSRALHIDEIVEAYKKGELKEVFGSGTAATISLIKELKYRDYIMNFEVDNWKIATEVKRRLNGIREGKLPDTHGWMYKVAQ